MYYLKNKNNQFLISNGIININDYLTKYRFLVKMLNKRLPV